MTVSFEPLGRILDGLVHGSAADDALAAARHRSFIAAHLAAGLAALMALPIWLATAGLPRPAVAVAFLFCVAPLPIAAFLSRTGRYATAHLMTAAALTGLAAWLAAFTGGIGSPVVAWLAVIPAEAALAGERRATAAAAALAALAMALLVVFGLAGLLPPPLAVSPVFAPAMVGAAILYAGLIALRIGTLHAHAVAAGRRGDDRYRLLADNATDLITRHLPNGDVAYASPAARTLIGCPPSELGGQGFFHRVHIGDRPAFLRALSEADRTGAIVSAEFRLRCGEGEGGGFLFAEMRCRPASDPASGRSVVAVTRDISSRRAEQEGLDAARIAADEAIRSRTQFLATVGHELRTPLNAIIGFSEILEQQLFGRFEFERHRDYARLIRNSGEHLLEVVDTILDLSKIEAGRFDIHVEPLAVAGLVEAAAEMMSGQLAGRRLTLVRRLPAGLPEIAADRRACRQILLNLLANAAKFTEPGGTVTIAARETRAGVAIEVADTGIGIAAADLPRLGTPYLQVGDTDRRREGTGLGLSVVKGLVELQGGTLAIASAPGVGTTVSVTLPLAEAQAGRVGGACIPRPAAGGAPLEKERRIA